MDFNCSSGRDKICTVWDLKQQKAKRTIPVYEVRLWKWGKSSYLLENTATPYLYVLAFSAGGRGYCYSARKSGFLSDWSKETKAAFHHRWQQRLISIMICSVSVFLSLMLLPSSLKAYCECGTPTQHVASLARPSLVPLQRMKRGKGMRRRRRPITPAVWRISSFCPPPWDWLQSQRNTT